MDVDEPRDQALVRGRRRSPSPAGASVPPCPTHAMRSPAMPTAPANPGAPVPSTTVTSVISDVEHGQRVGEEDAERRAAAGPLLDPGTAAVELGETADERRDRCPTPGECSAADPGTCRNGSKTSSRSSCRDPGSVVVDAEQDAAAPGPLAVTHTWASGGVWRRAFATRFSTIRSTFAASSATRAGADVHLDRAPRRVLALLHRAAHELGQVDRAGAAATRCRAGGGRGRAGRPGAARACASSPRSVGRGRRRRRSASRSERLLEGERRPEDRGERRPQVVRDGLEERVLHRVELAELLGRLPLAPERLAVLVLGGSQRLLGALALGDVDHQPAEDPALRSARRVHEVADPDLAVARRERGIRRRRRARRPPRRRPRSRRPLTVGLEHVVPPAKRPWPASSRRRARAG